MKIGLFFGSFNPIHHGHLIIASYIADFKAVDKVWFIVSPQNPLKRTSTLLNQYHRLNLLRLAIENDSRLKASDIEFQLPIPSYTIDTLHFITEKYPEHEFSIIMGSDSFSNLHKWKNYQVLLNNYRLFVYLRPGFDINETLFKPNIEVINAGLLDISSTSLRNLIKSRKSIRYLTPDNVIEEIEAGRYYQ